MNHFGDRENLNIIEQQAEQSKIETNIFDIVKNLSILFTQNEELTKHQRYVGHEEFNKLLRIKKELQWKWWLHHDISTLLVQALWIGEWDFDSQREFIQSDKDIKQRYEQEIETSINTITLIEQDKPIWDIISDLITLNTDFSHDLKTKNLNSKINNKQWDLYLLAIAYNLYNNASRFNIKDWEIFISISNWLDTIVITCHNMSYQSFSESNKKAILSWTWNVESQRWTHNKKGQWIYLEDLNHTLKQMKWRLTINNDIIASWYSNTITIILPKQQ